MADRDGEEQQGSRHSDAAAAAVAAEAAEAAGGFPLRALTLAPEVSHLFCSSFFLLLLLSPSSLCSLFFFL